MDDDSHRMAEREGFEPPIPVKVYTLSRRAPSATRPSLRAHQFRFILSGKKEEGRNYRKPENPRFSNPYIRLVSPHNSLLLLLFLVRSRGRPHQHWSRPDHEARCDWFRGDTV